MIDIKKSRILLYDDIANSLKEMVTAARREAGNRYRKGERKIIAATTETAHDSANRSIDEEAPDLEDCKTEIVGKNEIKLTNEHGTFNHKINIISSPKPGECRIIPVPSIDDGFYGNLVLLMKENMQ